MSKKTELATSSGSFAEGGRNATMIIIATMTQVLPLYKKMEATAAGHGCITIAECLLRMLPCNTWFWDFLLATRKRDVLVLRYTPLHTNTARGNVKVGVKK